MDEPSTLMPSLEQLPTPDAPFIQILGAAGGWWSSRKIRFCVFLPRNLQGFGATVGCFQAGRVGPSSFLPSLGGFEAVFGVTCWCDRERGNEPRNSGPLKPPVGRMV